ncbi:response regulator [Solirhodobacter olei]|uniref:response regulator n=1 Tax=Solirhodobacter olei TaxID=2493082 RepID=UPI0013E3BE33|nr:response regulator transcription factor [Solirhodobacter olei]
MRILAVDDDPLMLALISGSLSEVGYDDITLAGSAEELEEIFASDEADFDCMLLDIVMPDVDGIDLCRRIRAKDRYRNTHILMVTSRSDKLHIDRAFAAGASDYLAKPFEVHQLCARVAAAQRATARSSSRAAAALAAANGIAFDPARIEFAAPVTIQDVPSARSYNALVDNALHLPRLHLLGTRFFGIKIHGIGRVYASSSAQDYLAVLKEVAEAISSCLDSASFCFAYAGEGVFLCSARLQGDHDPADIEAHVNRTLKIRGKTAAAGLTVCCGALLRGGPFRSGDGVLKVLRLAMDSAIDKAHAVRAAAESTNLAFGA